MRNLYIYLSALSTLAPGGYSLRHGASQLRDLLAFPKYEIQFLTDLPLAESDAMKCRSLGISTLDEWLGVRAPAMSDQRIGDGSSEVPAQDRLDLIPMNLSPNGRSPPQPYLCLMPSKNETDLQNTAAREQDEIDRADHEIDPAQGWAALRHLEGTCLYSTQGWFTYSYCHNSHIRQFREARHPHPHPPGGYIPEEDATYDAYTLGRASGDAPRKAKPRSLTGGKADAQSPAQPPTSIDRANPHDHHGQVAVGLGASHRYLVQKWSDGTRCDKTGRPREIEVQVHCSMTSHDMIYLIKELAICSYVMIIHSPHLCGVPGFKVEQVDVTPAGIRCRQVLPDHEFEAWMNGEEEFVKPPMTIGHIQKGAVGMPQMDLKDLSNLADIKIEGLGQVDESLKDLLLNALNQLRGSDKGEQHPEIQEDVVVLSWEEGEDGPVLVEAEVVDDAEGQLGTQDQKELLDVVRRYLEKKDDKQKEGGRKEDGERIKDEL